MTTTYHNHGWIHDETTSATTALLAINTTLTSVQHMLNWPNALLRSVLGAETPKNVSQKSHLLRGLFARVLFLAILRRPLKRLIRRLCTRQRPRVATTSAALCDAYTSHGACSSHAPARL